MKKIIDYISESGKDSFSFSKEYKETVKIDYKYNYEITVNEYFWTSDETGEKFDLTKEDPNTIYQEHPTGKLSVDLDVEFDITPSIKIEGSGKDDIFYEMFTREDYGNSINGWFEMEYDGNSNDINGNLSYSDDDIKWSEILEKFASYYQDDYIQEYIAEIIREC
jgi:hypothetical protein